MKEIGGYIEFETYYHQMLHSDGIKLNCGRNCLAYLILARHIKKITLPYFMCDSVRDVCKKYGVVVRYYHVDSAFLPEQIELVDDEWLYLMNYYGQMTIEQIKTYVGKYKRVIVDYAHAYFEEPVPKIDTIYTCRKFFGVSDGAILYTNAEEPQIEIEKDESYERMRFLMGRFERSASEFYSESVSNNHIFVDAPIKKMSKLTCNLLHGIDYKRVKKRRTENFAYLAEHLENVNQLNLRRVEGAFAYPLMLLDGAEIRKQLIASKIFISILWPNVLQELPEDALEYQMVNNILPIPCDQRYSVADMEYVVDLIEAHITEVKEGKRN
ncbi:hypothetical protein [Desulfosporosinus nitroreducens]|uniref:DegT/DnrJ/EryC1/StrS aminotransferase family protein n=1 Tax=Desulfosporosinus nitroreducens TaxID=2018668 RepID=A0ABT8QSF2_9FIRM|nr:hypothetical protein [Desulfosporosinus nitroreducens]MDO0824289.1 hypothetical protein [Desulfosporosinus nitroreducens]